MKLAKSFFYLTSVILIALPAYSEESPIINTYLAKADAGEPEAQNILSREHEHKNDFKEALYWLLKLAENCENKPDACPNTASSRSKGNVYMRVGTYYKEGKGGTVKDLQEALKWFKKSAAAGYGPAQVELSFMLKEGIGGTANLVEAHKWASLAASNGGKVPQDLLKGIEQKMTTTEIEESKKNTAEWIANNSSK